MKSSLGSVAAVALVALFLAKMFTVAQDDPTSATASAVAHSAQQELRSSSQKEKPRFVVIPRKTSDEVLNGAAGANIRIWQSNFIYGNNTYPYTMVGTNPRVGSVTTRIPVVIIPIKFRFPGGTSLSASVPVCRGTKSAVALSKNSPLFNSYRFTPGGTYVGTTQYVDAFQRANFWSEVSSTSPNYHVLLNPLTVTKTQTVSIPSGLGSTKPGPCARVGNVDLQFFDAEVAKMLVRLKIPPTSLAIFLDYNTFFIDQSEGYILGYHSSTDVKNQTYVVAAYSDPGVFSGEPGIQDVMALSHELAEWMDDPFPPSNATPGWQGGQANACQFDLEVGDPVTGTVFPLTFRATTYHLQDLAFLPWFAQESPSGSVNGWYTFLNTYAAPPPVCSCSSFSTIDFPGAPVGYTFATGVNAYGEVSGWYQDTNTFVHGFMWRDGTYTSFDVPGSVYTDAAGINDSGQTVGYYSTANGMPSHGFLLDRGKFSSVDYPGAVGTRAFGINDRGQIVGYWTDSAAHGFVLTAKGYTRLDVPGANFTSAAGINDFGHIVGSYNDKGNRSRGFLLKDGKFTTINAPGGARTYALGINNLDQVVVLTDKGDSYIFSAGKFSAVSLCSAFNISAFAINNNGQIVGSSGSPQDSFLSSGSVGPAAGKSCR